MNDIIKGGAADILSAMGVPFAATVTNIMDEGLAELLSGREGRARRIALDEISKGERKPFEVAEKDEFVSIAYRYYQASMQGAANQNLRLLAQVMRGQVDTDSVDAGVYLSYADVLSGLQTNEIVYLGTLLKFFNEGEILKHAHGKEMDLDQSTWVKLSQKLIGTKLFPDKRYFNSCTASLLRTGLIFRSTGTADGGEIYDVSPRLEDLGKHVDFIGALKDEGIEI